MRQHLPRHRSSVDTKVKDIAGYVHPLIEGWTTGNPKQFEAAAREIVKAIELAREIIAEDLYREHTGGNR